MPTKAQSLGLLLAAGFPLWLFGSPQTPATPAGDVAIRMRNVNFRLADDIVLKVRKLRGDLIRNKAGEPVTFDDVESFKVAIDTAEVAITTPTFERSIQLVNGKAAYTGGMTLPLFNTCISQIIKSVG